MRRRDALFYRVAGNGTCGNRHEFLYFLVGYRDVQEGPGAAGSGQSSAA